MYRTAEEFLENLRVVQRSLAAAGARRAAYGPCLLYTSRCV